MSFCGEHDPFRSASEEPTDMRPPFRDAACNGNSTLPHRHKQTAADLLDPSDSQRCLDSLHSYRNGWS
jgi:hypothetical protein